MDESLRKQETVMDTYDPEKNVTLSVDEWGAWHAPLSGSNPAFLVQQNSIHDAILASLNLNIFAVTPAISFPASGLPGMSSEMVKQVFAVVMEFSITQTMRTKLRRKTRYM